VTERSVFSVDVEAGRRALAGVEPMPGVAKPDAVLVVGDLVRRFGGLSAVDVDSLQVQRHTITALIGPNGAGKTTLFNLLSGFDQRDRGSVTFDGHPIDDLAAYRIARLGMVRTFQLTKALGRLTVLDNMLLAVPHQSGERFLGAFVPSRWRRDERANTQRAMTVLERFRLADKAHDYAAQLSGGQKKLLEMARALMVDPALIMLDEPMAGVNPALVDSLLDHIVQFRDEGRTVVFVEHDMDVVMHISDWIVCMAEGRVIAEGPPASVGSNPAVIDAYLGRAHGEGSTTGG
jgi:branched-chain amino acid transport system ATP-binding protein